MVAPAQGIYKVLSYKKQSALGTPAAGAGGTQLRRETATFNFMKDTFNADEIVSHQQDTGISYGVSKIQGSLDDLVSAGSYAPLLASLCRTAFSAAVASTGLSLTIAGSAPSFTLTRAAGSFLTDGIKIGDVVRITAGSFTGVASNLNMVVKAVTALVLTVMVPNGKTLSAQGPVASATITVVNKKAVIANSGQNNDYYTFEEWYSDISLSRTFTDVQPASADISIPANGNSDLKMALVGLGRTKGGSQVLTSPSAASATAIMAGGNAVIMINAAQTVVGTSFSVKIDGQVTGGEAVIGSKTLSDNVKGDLMVSGTVTVLLQDETVSNLFVNETAVPITAILFADNTDTSDFVSFNIPAAKLTKDDVDDGKKQLIGTYDWVAGYNGSGGAAVSSDQAIISLQDSQA